MRQTILLIIVIYNIFQIVAGHTTTASIHLSLDSTASSDVYVLECLEYQYFHVDFPYPCKDLKIKVVPTIGDPDVFVSKTVTYPSYKDLTWAAAASNVYEVDISHWDSNSSPGYYYISVYNSCKSSSASAVYNITATTFIEEGSEDEDLYLHPEIGRNQLVAANDYKYFKFCIPDCGDVKVNLENCLNNTECPGKYSYPELLVSRTDVSPTVYDYTFKLAQIVKRFVIVNYTDPAARDRNGFLRGSYYVGVFGFCTPQQYVVNNDTDGPCAYAALTTFNVTVELFEAPLSSCNSSLLVYPAAPNYPNLDDGETYQGYVACDSYTYYMVPVNNPCYNLNVFVTTTLESDIKVAEIAMGKYPNIYPTFSNLEWTSYNWGDQNLTVIAWDPNFDGGYICGKNKDSLCYYYIGIYGYCVDNFDYPVLFELTVTQTRAHKIFDSPQLNQRIEPLSTNYYEFCVEKDSDVTAQLLSWTDSCSCPSKYTDFDMVISKTDRGADVNDLVWRVEHTEAGNKEIDLSVDDVDVRPGTYYLNVIAYCQNTTDCSDSCSCAPCANVANTSYAVFVNYTSSINSFDNSLSKYLGECNDVYEGECSSTCSTTTTNSSDSKSNGSRAIIISVVVVVFFLSMVYFAVYFYRKGGCKSSNTSYTSTKEDEVIDNGMNDTTLEVIKISNSSSHTK